MKLILKDRTLADLQPGEKFALKPGGEPTHLKLKPREGFDPTASSRGFCTPDIDQFNVVDMTTGEPRQMELTAPVFQPKREIPFCQLDGGQPFTYANVSYLKLLAPVTQDGYNSVSLSSGKLAVFAGSMQVIELELEGEWRYKC
jgi:hypothetical protein